MDTSFYSNEWFPSFISLIDFLNEFYYFYLFLAPKPRRRRPTTSNPLKNWTEKSNNEPDILPKTIQKTSSTEKRLGDVTQNADQLVVPSVNRFRVRTKPKTEAGNVPGNSSDIYLNKNKTNKDGYKVSVLYHS